MAEIPLAGRDDDVALLRAAASGVESAVRQLYRENVDAVHRCVVRILGRHDGDVEDVVQHTFLAALKGADRFDGRSKVSTWLIGIASRRAVDHARARGRRARWSRLTHAVGVGRPAPGPDVRQAALSVAERALSELTVEQRTVFVLHEVEGYTFKEITEMTDTGISTLHARLKAARRRLDSVLARLDAEALPSDDGVER